MAEKKGEKIGNCIIKKIDVIKSNYSVYWYAMCLMCLGLIDQRRGSAKGEIQMLFADLVPVVVFLLLIPSLKKEFFATRLFKIVTLVSLIIFFLFLFFTKDELLYWQQWNAVVISLGCSTLLLIYIFWDRKEAFRQWSISKRLGFSMLMTMFAFMILSVNEAHWPLLYLLSFGSFYVIGIPSKFQKGFLKGSLIGLITWFFIQQSLAFAFRPYDLARYKGFYSGTTQNGVFYMIVFCAFTGLWLLLKYNTSSLFYRILSFVLSAGCASFLLLTGVRSSLMGVAVGAFIGYVLFDIFIKKSFRHWILQGMMLGIFMVLFFPLAYGCVRYLPTVLRHPIWFEGEYREWGSVRSFDPADSDRYVTFEDAFNMNVGRIFATFGINVKVEDGKLHLKTPLSMEVDAAEVKEPGSSPDLPYRWERENEFIDPARATIYTYYIQHLNWQGHRRNESGFYYSADVFFGDAHNMFLQIAYDHGVIAGLLFIIWNSWCLIRLIRRRDITGIIGAMFLSAILAYGMTEQAVTSGQITLSLLFILYYWALVDSGDKYKKSFIIRL